MNPRDSRGQATVITVVFITFLLGMSALAIDVGSWWKEKRDLQAVADSAALAGAQALPENPATARALAVQYAAANGHPIDGAADITFSRGVVSNDTITVHTHEDAPGFFSKLFGIDSVAVGAHAGARTGTPGSAEYVAPITVSRTHPMLQCTPPPCTGTATVTLNDLHSPGWANAAGSFSLLDLVQGGHGNEGQSTVAGWMTTGYPQEMPLDTYYAEPSTFFNASAFQSALSGRIGQEVLLPVYQPPILAGGSNAAFDIVAWVGFHIDSVSASGSNGTLTGHFTRFLAHGIQATSWNPNDLGVRVVQLVN